MNSIPPPIYVIPPELRTAPPRAVRRREGIGCAVIFVRLFILPHTLLGIGLLCAVVGEPVLIALTPNVPGVVTRLYNHTDSKGGTSYNVAYSYSLVSSGKAASLAGDDSIPESEFRARRQGDRIFVHAVSIGRFRYATISRSFGGYVRHASFLWFFAAFWNGIMSVFVYLVWVQPIIRRRLIRNGQPVVGKITDKYIDGGKSDTYHLKYEFDTIDIHPAHFENTITITSQQYDPAVEGGAVTILYNPAHPKRNVAYEYSGFRAILR